MAACFFSSGFSFSGVLMSFVSFFVSCSFLTTTGCSAAAFDVEVEGSAFSIFGCDGSKSFFNISSTIFTPVDDAVGSLGAIGTSSFLA